MKLQQRLTKAQMARISAEQKRYAAAVARAKKEGRDFDPLDEAPTGNLDPASYNDPVQKASRDIWFGEKTHG